jgi:hypothetical protein
MVPAADIALVGPIAFLLVLALNIALLRRHAGAFADALRGQGHAPQAIEDCPPGESNVVLLRPALAVRQSARPALRLAA